MRGTFVYRNGEMVPKHLASSAPRGPVSDLPCPMLIRDGIDPLKSMLDGRLYESKSELRATYKAAGVRELGNDAPTAAARPERPGGIKTDLIEAYQKVNQGYKPNIEHVAGVSASTGWTEYGGDDD